MIYFIIIGMIIALLIVSTDETTKKQHIVLKIILVLFSWVTVIGTPVLELIHKLEKLNKEKS